VTGVGETVLCQSEEDACRRTVSAVRDGDCSIAVKGIAHTDTFLRAVLNKEYGLNKGRLISNVFAFEKPSGGLCLLTDPSIVIAPTLEQKAQMIQNCVDLASDLGIERPKVAVIAAVETVTSSMPETIEAAALAKMAERGQIKNCVVDGPLALDNAVSELAMRIKGIKSAVAGDADVLLCQHIVVANVLSKALSFYAGMELAANVVGTSHPTVIVSRADSPRTRLLSIALGKVRLANTASFHTAGDK